MVGAAMNCGRTTGSGDILLDSRASLHIKTRKDWLSEVKVIQPVNVLPAAKTSKLSSQASGKLALKSKFGGLVLGDYLVVEDMTTHLVAVSKLTDSNNCKVTFDNDVAEVYHKPSKCVITRAIKDTGLYYTDALVDTPRILQARCS